MKLSKTQLILMFGEFTDRVNFYGIQSILILYLMHKFLFSQHHSLTIYGVYSSFCFISPLIGGYCADKFFNRSKFVLLGIIFILLGNIIFLLDSSATLFLAIDFIIIGIGLFKPNNITLFGNACDDAKQKYPAFTLYYAVMTSGAIIGPFLYSTLQVTINWRTSFTVSLIFSVCSLIFYLLKLNIAPELIQPAKPTKNALLKISLIMILLFLGIYLCLLYNELFTIIIGSSVVGVIIFSIYHLMVLPPDAKNQQILLFVLMVFGLLFYAVTFQVSSTLILYANALVKVKVLGFDIPPEYFMSIYSIFIAISAFMSTKMCSINKKIDGRLLVNKISLSLYLGTGSFFILAISTIFNSSASALQVLFILLGLFVLGLGELAVGPVINMAISQLVPEHKNGGFMGLWCLLIGYAAYLSSLMAKMIDLPNYTKTFCIYFQSFVIIAAFTLILALSMSLMKERLNRLFLG